MSSTCMRVISAACAMSLLSACDAHREPEPGATAEAPAPAATPAKAAAQVDPDPAAPLAQSAPATQPPDPRPIADGDAPVPPDPEITPAPWSADGRDVFMRKCKGCHGRDGKADTKMGRKHDVPDATASDWDRKWPLPKIVKIVTQGKAGTKMRAFAGKLSVAEIEAVSEFMRAL